VVTELLADVTPVLDERQRRLAAAAGARALGHGGVAAVARETGLARSTIRRGVQELERGVELEGGRVRRRGAGRKPHTETDPKLVGALDALVDPESRDDPESPLRWTCKSTRQLADALTDAGHPASHVLVGELLREQLGFRLQGNAKTIEGKQHPDRDAQFRYINEQVRRHQRARQPVISVDAAKKKEIGRYKSVGREWEPSREPVQVQGHDFCAPEVPRAFLQGPGRRTWERSMPRSGAPTRDVVRCSRHLAAGVCPGAIAPKSPYRPCRLPQQLCSQSLLGWSVCQKVARLPALGPRPSVMRSTL
jgi:Rhodopirellula transposase DDE domain